MLSSVQVCWSDWKPGPVFYVTITCWEPGKLQSSFAGLMKELEGLVRVYECKLKSINENDNKKERDWVRLTEGVSDSESLWFFVF